jgi:MoxR-like ATPase
MTDDLELRLRQPAVFSEPAESQRCRLVMAKAADELARLRAENEALREALDALRLQALQSDLNNPANEWGWEALQLANAALKGPSHE